MKKIVNFLLLAVLLTACNVSNVVTSSYTDNDRRVELDTEGHNAYIVKYQDYDSVWRGHLHFTDCKFFTPIDSVSRNGKIIWSKFNGRPMVTRLNERVEVLSVEEMKQRGYSY